uniref:F-box protein 40 n=1 Tax=Sinocyclocheilus grahami TaxID=75366 RepID=A0A672S8V7_SINGR
IGGSDYRRSGPRLHRYCETCFSCRCKASIEVTVSCMFINCCLLCGASFHMCKEDEHSLLCPNEKVPCLNAHYGCPFTMCHSRLAKHLEVCPTSVVFCSMAWNHWPLENPDAPLYSNQLKELHEQESLDLSMALRDQKHLCAWLKIRKCFPELMEEQEEEPAAVEEYDDEEEAVGKEIMCNGMHVNGRGSSGGGLVNGPSKACEKALKEDVVLNGPVDKDKYNLFEKLFSMEMGGCKQAEATKTEEQNGKKTSSKGSLKLQGASVQPEKKEANVSHVDITKTGLAPWQDGVLERLGQEVKPRKFNMYIVHHGRMLISFDFVYGKLEPIPVQSLRSFKVPSSYKKRRIQLREFNTRVMTEHKGVGTSDLGMSEKDGGEMDEMFLTLLCYAEVEIRGHKITESGPRVSPEGTTNPALRLRTSATTYSDGTSFLHHKNVHSDIQSCVSGWFEQRCTLSYLVHSEKVSTQLSQRSTVFYNKELNTFCLQAEVSDKLYEGIKPVTVERKRACNTDALSRLTFEVLVHIAGFLDSFTLSRLALVSRLMREVCRTLLHDRGMVSLKWEKKVYSHGGWCWRVWQFSNLFSTVDSWCFDKLPPISEHLKVCPYYQRENKKAPVSLTGVHECHEKEAHRNQSLVSMFMKNK